MSALRSVVFPAPDGPVTNTSSPEDISKLKDLVEILKENLIELDSKIKDIQVIHGPNRVGDIPHSLASIDKAKKLLNYNPKYSFQEGLV